VYRDWSFRSTPSWVKENYFTRNRDGSYSIHSEVKRMVSFSYLNLAEDIFPSILNDTHAMDLILCRNVMIYFNLKQVKRVVDRFFHSLLNHGWFIVGSSEASHIFFPQYVPVNFPGAIFFQKDKSTSAKTRRPVPTIPEIKEIPPREKKRIIASRPVVQKEKIKSAEPATYDNVLTLYNQGHYTEVIEKSREMLAQNEGDTRVIFLLSKAYADTGKIQDALRWCEKAIGTEKLDPNFYHLHAVILQEQNRFEEALTSLKTALYLDPNFVLVYFMAGNLARQLGKDKEADKYFENAHSLLSKHERDSVLPEADGLTAGRLMELIQFMRSEEIPA
jgi:chemotaxis protein methyltransferase CheR